jgi:hypothetical protein
MRSVIFFALPLGEDAKQMEEHPASGSAGVNRFREGNEVGLVLVKIIGEIFQFAAVAGQAGEF